MWSFSNGRIFDKWQRWWFYKNHVANANATKNPLQREAYLLLASFSLWFNKIGSWSMTRMHRRGPLGL